jgi:mono/diheme cytochrome c family protein
MRKEIKGAVLGLAVSAGVLVAALASGPTLQSTNGAAPPRDAQTNPGSPEPAAPLHGRVELGNNLFAHNCAHCHGDDASGDEGPSLHNLDLSDARIAKKIREGVKGEMPRFGSKFKDTEIEALVAFIRTLKS